MKLSQRGATIIGFLILAWATSVRLLGIKFGLPYVLYPDEALIVNHAMAFGTGDLNPHYFVYPSLYMYLLFGVYGATYVAGWLFGAFSAPADFIRLFFTDTTIFYLPGRLIAALAGVLTVAIIYKLGRRAYRLEVGLVAAALLSVSVLHVSYSHFVKTHVPAGLLATMVLWFAWSVYQSGTWRSYIWAGVAAGLAASTVYHAGLAIVCVIVAHLLRPAQNGKVRLFDARIFGAAVASLTAFCLTTPFAILDNGTFLSDLASTGAVYYGGGIWENGAFYPFISLISSFGQPVGAVALLGLGYALLRHRPADLIFASQPLFLGVFLMLFRVKEATHMLVAFPAVALLAASFIVDVTRWLFRRYAPAQGVACATVAGLLVIAPAKHSFEASHRLSLPDTRILAKHWVEANIPRGSRVVMDSGKYYLEAYGPPLPLSRRTLRELAARGAASAAGKLAGREGTRRIGYSGESAYFEYALNALGERQGYDVVQVLHDPGSATSDVLTLKQYVNEGVQYAIVSSYARDAYLPDTAEAARHPEKAARYRTFYDCLEERALLLKEFKPSNQTVGPALKIYRIVRDSRRPAEFAGPGEPGSRSKFVHNPAKNPESLGETAQPTSCSDGDCC